MLAARVRSGAMQIMAGLLKCGKADAIWRLLLNTEAEGGKTGGLFLSKHSQAPSRRCSQCRASSACSTTRAELLLDWVMEYESDIKLCLNATLVPRWVDFEKAGQAERKAQFAVIDNRLRAFQRLRQMEGQERSPATLTTTEQRRGART